MGLPVTIINSGSPNSRIVTLTHRCAEFRVPGAFQPLDMCTSLEYLNRGKSYSYPYLLSEAQRGYMTHPRSQAHRKPGGMGSDSVLGGS